MKRCIPDPGSRAARPFPRRRFLTLAGGAAALAACSSPARPPPSPAAGPPADAGPLRFSFQAVDGRPISTESLRNRVSVIGLIATYDVHSQAQARFLALLERHHTPRLNVAALVLEAAENKPLVEAFVAAMGIGYPVAMADAATIAGEGPFAGLHHVPSVVILDRAGREAWRRVGFVSEVALEAAVRGVEATSPPPREIDPSADGGT